MRVIIAYSKIKKRNLVLINNATYQRETLSEQPIRLPLNKYKLVVLHYKNWKYNQWGQWVIVKLRSKMFRGLCVKVTASLIQADEE